ncbi:Sugar (and other) transporter [Rhizoctonia solani]|uniref:Sugar (And other) transporter n=1 Tax=Rhizoctonia solani TaxID=456999 RepID=A0A8H8SYM9_9AGAM|nr:Sugar (and other) transporter [Rhizoctonia solani]QRW23411.1 Sugar (and other) transporter [Rhizoctonia solani]
MTLKRVEDRPTPREVYNWRPYLLALIAGWGVPYLPVFLSLEVLNIISNAYVCTRSYDSAFIGGTIELLAFQAQFGLDQLSEDELAFTSSNIVSTYQAGCFFGCIAAFFIVETFGRRITLQCSSALFCLGAGLMLGAKHSLGMIFLGRIVGGLGVGGVSLATPLYIAEIAPPSIRGQLVGFYEIFLQAGGVVGFWINFGISEHVSFGSKQWHIPVAVQLIPGGLLLVASVSLRETPRWLYRKGQLNDAIVNLSWIRNLPADHPYIQQEMEGIRAQFQREMQENGTGGFMTKLKELTKPGIRNRLGVGMCIMMCQNLTGMNAINYYSPTIFSSIGITGTNNSLFATGIYGVVKMVATLIALVWLVDRVGRRKPLIAGAVVGALAMYYIAGFVAVAKPSNVGSPSPAGKFAAACIYIFAVAFCMSWNGISWIICSEIFPLSVRALGQAITSATQWLWQFVIARSTPYMIKNIGYGTYLFFGSCMVLMIPWVYFILPETKGVSLEDMDRLFGYCPHGDNVVIEEGLSKGEIVEREVVGSGVHGQI